MAKKVIHFSIYMMNDGFNSIFIIVIDIWTAKGGRLHWADVIDCFDDDVNGLCG